MFDLAEKILKTIKSRGQYTYSTNLSEKSEELKALDYLENNGLIIVKSRALGYVIAEAID